MEIRWGQSRNFLHVPLSRYSDSEELSHRIKMSSITGLGLRNKVGLGKSNDSSSKPKQQGSSITGLGLRNKVSSFEI
jgi:hypothetical protein